MELSGAADTDFYTPAATSAVTETPLMKAVAALPALVSNPGPWRVGVAVNSYTLPTDREDAANWQLTIDNNKGFTPQVYAPSTSPITISAFQDSTVGFGAGNRAGSDSDTLYTLSLQILGNDANDYILASDVDTTSTATKKDFPEPVVSVSASSSWNLDISATVDFSSIDEGAGDLGYGTGLQIEWYYNRSNPEVDSPTALLATSGNMTSTGTNTWNETDSIDTGLNPEGFRAGAPHYVRAKVIPVGADFLDDLNTSAYSLSDNAEPNKANLDGITTLSTSTIDDSWTASLTVSSTVPTGYLNSDFEHVVDYRWPIEDRATPDDTGAWTTEWRVLDLGAPSTNSIWETGSQNVGLRGQRTLEIRASIRPKSAGGSKDFTTATPTPVEFLVTGQRWISSITDVATLSSSTGEWSAQSCTATIGSGLTSLGYAASNFDTILTIYGTDRDTFTSQFYSGLLVSNGSGTDSGSTYFANITPGSRTQNITFGAKIRPTASNFDWEAGSTHQGEVSRSQATTKRALQLNPTINGTAYEWFNTIQVGGNGAGEINDSEYSTSLWRLAVEYRAVSEDRLTTADGSYANLNSNIFVSGDMDGNFSGSTTLNLGGAPLGTRGDRTYQARVKLRAYAGAALADWIDSSWVETARTGIIVNKKAMSNVVTGTPPTPSNSSVEWGRYYTAGITDDPMVPWGNTNFEIVVGYRYGTSDPFVGSDDNWQTVALSDSGGVYTWSVTWSSAGGAPGLRGGRYLDVRYRIRPKAGTNADGDITGLTNFSDYSIGGPTGKKTAPTPTNISVTAVKWGIDVSAAISFSGINTTDYPNTDWRYDIDRQYVGDRIAGTGSLIDFVSPADTGPGTFNHTQSWAGFGAGDRGGRTSRFAVRLRPYQTDSLNDWEDSPFLYSSSATTLKANYATPSRGVTALTGSNGWNYTVTYSAEAGETGFTGGELGSPTTYIAQNSSGTNAHTTGGDSLTTRSRDSYPTAYTDIRPSEFDSSPPGPTNRHSRRAIAASNDYNAYDSGWVEITVAPAKRNQNAPSALSVAAISWGYTITRVTNMVGTDTIEMRRGWNTSVGDEPSTTSSPLSWSLVLRPSDHNGDVNTYRVQYRQSSTGSVDYNSYTGAWTNIDVLPGKRALSSLIGSQVTSRIPDATNNVWAISYGDNVSESAFWDYPASEFIVTLDRRYGTYSTYNNDTTTLVGDRLGGTGDLSDTNVTPSDYGSGWSWSYNWNLSGTTAGNRGVRNLRLRYKYVPNSGKAATDLDGDSGWSRFVGGTTQKKSQTITTGTPAAGKWSVNVPGTATSGRTVTYSYSGPSVGGSTTGGWILPSQYASGSSLTIYLNCSGDNDWFAAPQVTKVVASSGGDYAEAPLPATGSFRFNLSSLSTDSYGVNALIDIRFTGSTSNPSLTHDYGSSNMTLRGYSAYNGSNLGTQVLSLNPSGMNVGSGSEQTIWSGTYPMDWGTGVITVRYIEFIIGALASDFTGNGTGAPTSNNTF
jgi:hypothetical protein